ncbi:MAG: carbon storage regulator CsrA [Firmicutes bacterium]|nr:carbon storage regulator CsrA [Bacillota bacterium]
MLVLTRRRGESIVLGDDIEISVLEVNGDAVRIGIEAPREVPIYRREIYEAIRAENISAARAAEKMKKIIKKMPLPSSDK